MALCGHFRSPVTNTPRLWGPTFIDFQLCCFLAVARIRFNQYTPMLCAGWPSVPEAASTALPPPPVLSTPTPHMLDGPPRLSVPRCRGPHARSTAGPGPPSRHPRCIMHDPVLALSRFFRLGWRGGRCAGGCSAHLRQSRRTWQASSVRQGPDRCSFLKGSFDGRSELAMGIFSLPTSHACYIHFFMLCMVLFKWSFILSLCDENMAST